MTKQEINNIATSSVVKKLTAVVTPIVKSGIDSGMSLKEVEKRIDKELKKVTNIVKSLAMAEFKRG
jgi:hypothetical protein